MLDTLHKRTPSWRAISEEVLGFSAGWAKKTRAANGGTTLARYQALKQAVEEMKNPQATRSAPAKAVSAPSRAPLAASSNHSLAWVDEVSEQLRQIETLILEKSENMPRILRGGFHELYQRVESLRGEFART